MGINLELRGRRPKAGFFSRGKAPEVWLRELEAWLRAECDAFLEVVELGPDEQGRPAMGFQLHPAAERVRVMAHGHDILVSAKTSSVGPGYHVFVCDLLKRWEKDLQVAWQPPDPAAGFVDEGGYFHGGSFADVERATLDWLRNTAARLLELHDQGYADLQLSIAEGHSFRHDGALSTPMGPRSRAWFEAAAAGDPCGRDIFPWWDQGTGAAYHRGRAIALMWTEVRWRASMIPKERLVHLRACNALAEAQRLDPALPLPWREWVELLGFLKTPAEDLKVFTDRAREMPDGPRIGYRRREVRVQLPGEWSIEVPGSLAEDFDENGTWIGWDERRTVRVSSAQISNKGRLIPVDEALDLDGGMRKYKEVLDHQGPRVRGKAAWHPHEENGQRLWSLSCRSAVPGSLAVCLIYVADEQDRDWAIRIWQSLDHPEVNAGE